MCLPLAVDVAPSIVAKSISNLPSSVFAINHPPASDVVPLALLHPIFSEFVANVKQHRPTQNDYDLARDLRAAMPQAWDTEAAQCETFRSILTKHYGIQLYAAEIGGTSRRADGHLMVGSFMSTVFEGKTWRDSGCPEVQSCLYWLTSIGKPVQNSDPHDLLPCIIVFLIGVCLFPTLYPCLLSIDPFIGFSGVVLTDRIRLESLTECFPLHTNPHENDMAVRVARAFGAYRIAANKLDKHYQSQVEYKDTRDACKVIFPYPDSLTIDGGVNCKFTYCSRLDNNKLIYLATTTERATVLVKFTRRYSLEAHQFCANAGVAPKLIGLRPLPAGWYMAIMEYLGPEIYRVLEPSDSSNANLVAEIYKVVKTLHNGGFVHGDIWRINMMTRHLCEWRG